MNTVLEDVCSLFDQSGDLVQVVALDGTLIYTNPTWRTVLGYEAATIAPSSFLEVLHGDDRDHYQQVCTQLQFNGDHCTLSLTLLTQDGAMVPVEGRVSFRVDKGEPPQLWCLWRRVQQPVKQTLRQVEERYSLATRAARVGVWEWQVQTGEFYLDPNVKAILGYTDAEIPNDLNLWVNYVHPDDRQPVMAAAQLHMDGHTPEYVCEHRMLHKDGTIRWILVRGLAIRNSQGEVVRMVGTDTDITDRKRSEILLELQNRILAKIASGDPLEAILSELMGAIEVQLEGALSSILLLDSSNRLRPEAAPSLPEAYVQLTDGILIGEGVGSCGTAVVRRKPVITSDIAIDPLWRNFKNLALEHGLQACWSMPIIARDSRVLGTFAVYFPTARSPQGNELEVLGMAANIARIAIERHQAETVLQQKAEQGRLIAHLTRQIRQSLDLDVILQTTVTEVRQLLDTDRVAIYRFNPDGSGTIVVESVLQPWKAILESTLHDPCFTGDLVEQYRRGKIFQVADVQNAGLSPCYVEFLTQFQIRGNLVVPILQEGYLWGLVFVHHCGSPRPWQPQEVELLSQLANQLAIAIQQATTHRQLQEGLKIRQQTEAALRDSEAQNRAILSAIPDILTVIRADGSYLHFSRNGFVGEVLPVPAGAHVTDVLPPDEAARKIRAIQEVLRTGEMQLYEQQFEWGDRVQYEEVRIVPYREDAILSMVRNISDRKLLEIQREQAEQQLQQLNQELEATVEQRTAQLRDSEERFRSLYEQSPLGISIADLDGRLLQVNDRFCQITGYTAADLLSCHFSSIIYPADRLACLKQFEQVATGKQQQGVIEKRYITKTREIVWVQATKAILRDRQGQPAGIVSMVQNISDRKAAESALAESEARFRTLTANLPGAIYRCLPDANWTYVYLSQGFQTLTGFAPTEVTCRADHLHPDDLEPLTQLVETALANRQPFVLEYRLCCADGNYKWVHEEGQGYWDEQGNCLYLDGVILDISDRKRLESERQVAELALRESETRFRTLVQNVNVGIVVYDAQTNILLSNPNALELLGVDEAQMVGKTIFDPQWQMIHEDGSPLSRSEHPVSCAIATRQAVRHAVVGMYRSSDGMQTDLHSGNVVWLLVNADPQLNHDGAVQEVIVSFADITYRKHLETEVLKALQKERELSEIKSRFVAMVSHEFRTPLSVIRSASELLQHYEWDTNGQQGYFHQIYTAVEHMTHLMEDVLLINKMDSGHIQINRCPVDLIEFCRCLITEVQLAYSKNHELKFSFCGEPTLMSLDPKLLRQMLANLLSNAIKYSPEGSEVLLHLVYQPNQVIVQVQDYGIGIPKTEQKELFVAFQRATNVSTIQGTGLGLAIVKHCVDLHDGQISLESQVGIGTTVTVSLPLI
jgi:PAS domain S-box-containing protein